MSTSQPTDQDLDVRRIQTVRIYPPIGIARVGNSVDKDGWFYGPEAPGRFDEPTGGFKDAQGAVKRQVCLSVHSFLFLSIDKLPP
jgi:hypothetical protein